MKFGGDYLGGVKFQKAAIQAHPAGWAAGVFLKTFGDAAKFIDALCSTGKVSEFVIHLATFDYDHSYDIKPNMPGLLKDAARMNALSLKHPNVVFLLSPFCEHNHKAAVMVPVFEQLKKAAPNCSFVNSVWLGQPVPGIITEVHVSNDRTPPAPRGEFTISYDGCGNMTGRDLPADFRKYAGARHIRWWGTRCNGKSQKDGKIDIPSRKNWPDSSYLKAHNASMGAREGTLTWPKSALWKPLAEDTGNADAKANHAMCIIETKATEALVLDRNGKVIDKMRRLGNFDLNGKKCGRFYSSKWAYQLGDIAMRNTGSREIQVKAGGVKLPLTDADLRSGMFR
jgi:hypothetical protein